MTSTDTHAALSRESFPHSVSAARRAEAARYLAGVFALALAYVAVAKGAQALHYTASVSAIWPPAGVGIAVLYLAGIRWWPGIFLGELIINGELLASNNGLPVGSLIGQQAGNMAEVIVGALLLRRLIGRRAALDRTEQVGGMLLALGTATAISATVRHRLDARRGRDHTLRGAHFLANMVARRLGRRARRLSARGHLGEGSEGDLAQTCYVGGGLAARGRDRPCRRLGLDQRGGDLHGLPGIDLGGFPLRPCHRRTLHCDRRGAGDRNHRARARGVLQAPDRRKGAEHAAVHPGGSAHDALPERRRRGAQEIHLGLGRCTYPRRRARAGGAPPNRARATRFRLPGVVLDDAAHAHGARELSRARTTPPPVHSAGS